MWDKICYLCNKPASVILDGVPLCSFCSKKEEPDFFRDERRGSQELKITERVAALWTTKADFPNEEKEEWR